MSLYTIVNLPNILDSRGNLSFAENLSQVPFRIKRAYWIYDVPGGTDRGGHAYAENTEFVIALSGSFDVLLDNGEQVEKFSLNRSYYGLLIPRMVWRTMVNFSTNSLALILSSTEYKESDYIRDYHEFLKAVRNEKDNGF